ncbi:MAG: GSU2403 family nucleotidyltransferase fold protein [Sneathiellaceae bacterium]
MAYHDLLSLLLDDAVSDMRGSPTPRSQGGRTYWYDRYRVGTTIRERYLGEDSTSLRQRIEKHEQLRQDDRQRRRERARLVGLLRSERFLGLDGKAGSLTTAFARAGVFRLGGTLVGTTAFRLYEGELGLRLAMDQTATARDIDIASFEKLSLALDDAGSPPWADVFHDLAFTPMPTMEPGRTWRWRQGSGETFVEFLTPSFDEQEAVRDLPALGVGAQSLHHLNYLIADPLDAAAIYREGVLVRVPRPERFAIHKLIVADRRREGPDSPKSQKDLLQAQILIAMLSVDRPMDLAEAYEDARGRGPHWRKRLDRSLARAPAAARELETAGAYD